MPLSNKALDEIKLRRDGWSRWKIGIEGTSVAEVNMYIKVIPTLLIVVTLGMV